VHGEELVEGLRGKERVFRADQLDAHEQGQDAGDQEEGEGDPHDPASQRVVLQGFQQADQAGRVRPGPGQLLFLLGQLGMAETGLIAGSRLRLDRGRLESPNYSNVCK
jgi:hypothetical protein